MRTTEIRGKIKEFLDENPRSTPEILEYINSVTRHGTTSQQLGNVLSKDRDIIKLGYVMRAGIAKGRYKVCHWALADQYNESVASRSKDPEMPLYEPNLEQKL